MLTALRFSATSGREAERVEKRRKEWEVGRKRMGRGTEMVEKRVERGCKGWKMVVKRMTG